MIKILHYKNVNKGALVGSFDICIEKWGGFIIREMSYFKKAHQRWVCFPQRQFEVEGQKKYMQYCKFEEDSMLKSFEKKILDALDEHFKKSAYVPEQLEIPF